MPFYSSSLFFHLFYRPASICSALFNMQMRILRPCYHHFPCEVQGLQTWGSPLPCMMRCPRCCPHSLRPTSHTALLCSVSAAGTQRHRSLLSLPLSHPPIAVFFLTFQVHHFLSDLKHILLPTFRGDCSRRKPLSCAPPPNAFPLLPTLSFP